VAYTYHELKEKTIQELREIAKGVQHAHSTHRDQSVHAIVITGTTAS